MTQEEKRLLIKDMCARIPDGLKVLYNDSLECQPSGVVKINNKTYFMAFGVAMPLEVDGIKPYLRPMSSMTKEESKEFALFQTDFYIDGFLYPIAAINMINWLISHHFDYRGLIEKGQAIEVTNENNPYKS